MGRSNNSEFKDIAMHAFRRCATFNMRKASRLVGQFYDQAFSPLGIKTTQFSLLLAIAYFEPATIIQLANIMGMDRTTLSRNVRVLAKNGLAILTKGSDRREQLVQLTDQGTDLLKQGLPVWDETQARFEEIFGQEWTDKLLADLARVHRKMD